MIWNQCSMAAARGRLASLIFLCCLLACKMPNDKVLPRNQNLPLFDPHVPDFICETEASKVPPIDAQAEDWFLEARAMEDPEIFVEDRDYKKIVDLTRQAAERLNKRARILMERFAADPTASVPKACQDWGETMAAIPARP